MPRIRSITSHELKGAERPTLEALLVHAEKYGIGEPTGWRNQSKRYGSYAKLAKNPFIEVAFDYLSAQAYAFLVEAVGYGEFAAEAKADWLAERGETDGD